jgi:hypothetical protein
MDGGRANLDGDERVQATNGSFERSECKVFIRKDSETRGISIDAKGDTSLVEMKG